MKSIQSFPRVLFLAFAIYSSTSSAQSNNYQNYEDYADEYAQQDNLYTDYSTKQQQKLAGGGDGAGGA
jgi:glutamyl/glutaminyl-tRNA synthetase